MIIALIIDVKNFLFKYLIIFCNEYLLKIKLDGVVISDSAQDLIKKMLCPEADRLSCQQVLEHPFLVSAFKRHPQCDSTKENDSLRLKNLKDYSNSTLMQRVIYTAISQRLSYAEIDNLQEIFSELDRDHDGQISNKEFTEGLQTLKLTH